MIPNMMSLSRILFAAAFFQENTLIRLLAVVLALLSDGLDGFSARQFKMTSKIGVVLDPIADRIFVAVAVAIFFLEGKIEPWQVAALFSRDFGIFLFGFTLLLKRKSASLHALFSGKIATVIQLLVLFLLTLNYAVPAPLFYLLAALGPLAFLELKIPLKLQQFD